MIPVFAPCVVISFCFLITNPTSFENVCYHLAIIAIGYMGGKMYGNDATVRAKSNDNEEENSEDDGAENSSGGDGSSSENEDESDKNDENKESDDEKRNEEKCDESSSSSGDDCNSDSSSSNESDGGHDGGDNDMESRGGGYGPLMSGGRVSRRFSKRSESERDAGTEGPRQVRGFTVFSKDAALKVLKFYEWLESQEPRDVDAQTGDVVNSKENIVKSIDHRRQLEEMLDKLYHDEFMWSLLSKQLNSDAKFSTSGSSEESGHGTALSDKISQCRLDSSEELADDEAAATDLDPDGRSCQDIISQWCRLVRIIFIKLLQIDFALFEKIDAKQEKVYFVTHYMIPVLGKYKDIYTSPDIFPFGTKHVYMRAVLKKMLELINMHGCLEALVLFACLWPELVQTDCHPTINIDPDVKPRASLAILKHDRNYGALLSLIPSQCLDMFRE